MPTLPVHPHDGESLQAIADALVKARKVVVVTGAGISTNSGIPDFRSENGLYQMIQEQYEAAARAPAPQPPGPKPDSGNPVEEAIAEFPEDRPKKRQRLSQASNEDSQVLPEITVGDGACSDGRQRETDGGAETKMEGEITCAMGAALDAPAPKDSLDDVLPQTKTKGDPSESRASSCPLVRRRSARLNPEAQGITAPEAHTQAFSNNTLDPQRHPAQSAGPAMPSTPAKTRRQTVPSILPGSSSPLSDAPSQVSSPSKIFDLPSLLQTSSPLSDPLSHLGISSPFFERPTFRSAAFPSSSSLLSDPPSHLASSPFLSHLAPVRRSSPPSDPPAYLPSSPPINRRAHLVSLKSSSPLSSPPQFLLNPYEEPDSRQTVSQGGSPSPATRETLNSQRTSTSNSSSASQNSSSPAEESSQSDSCDCSQQDQAFDKQGETQVAEEIHCAPDPALRPEPSSQRLSTETTQSREADESTSSNLVSSQGSTTSARLPIPNIKGRDLFDASIWACPVRTSVFYTFATTLRQRVRDVTPTSSHVFIGHLRDRGKLVRCYTQNIDRIEEKVGLSTALDQGPGHRSRFSRRAPALSRGQSGASDAPAPYDGLSSSALTAQGEPNSVRATDPCDLAHGQGKGAHKRRDEGVPGTFREGRPDPDACRASDRTTADGACVGSSEAPWRDSTHPDDPGSSLGNRGEGSQPNNAVETTQQRDAHLVDNHAPSKRGGSPTGSQESSEGRDAGPAAPKPKAPQRQSTLSSGVECVFLHGSLESLRCFRCRRVCEWEGLEDQTFVGQQPECPHCAGATAAREERGKRALGVGKLRPDIVLYGEEHPNAHLISPVVTHDLGLGPDLLLILGTSLKVHGLKVLVRQFAKAVHSKGGKVVFVNFTKPPESSWGDIIDYWVAWDCDAWVGDLKEKVPALWLPPGEEPKKRKSVNAKGTEKRTGEKKGAPKKKKSVSGTKGGANKDEKAGAEIVVSSQESVIKVAREGAAADTGVCTTQETAANIITTNPRAALPESQQSQPDSEGGTQKDRPQQRRVNLREDKVNGAYFTWKIMESLRSISGRTPPPPMDLPSVTASRAIATAEATRARSERKRRSMVAAEKEQKPVTVTPVPVPRMPEVWSIHSSAPLLQQGDATAVRRTTMPPSLPLSQKSTSAASKMMGKSLPFDTRRDPSTPKTNHKTTPGTSISARADPRKRKLACLQPVTPTDVPTSSISQPSILAAVKSNPRKRKRKTIDGEEVVLPSVTSRKLSLSSADKENVEVRRRVIPPLSAQPMDQMPIKLPPLKGVAGNGWKPPPMEPVSSPSGPAERFEGEGKGSGVGLGNAFFYEGLLRGL